MLSIQKDMEYFKNQLKEGSVQRAYRALISFMMGLRTHFSNKVGESSVSTLYQGYMDMTYFAIFPESLKNIGLKVAIVFNYEAFRFEAWLAARNRSIQRKYWQILKEGHWDEYRLVAPGEGIDSIIECDLADAFDIGEPDGLAVKIEGAIASCVDDIEGFLSVHQPEEV